MFSLVKIRKMLERDSSIKTAKILSEINAEGLDIWVILPIQSTITTGVSANIHLSGELRIKFINVVEDINTTEVIAVITKANAIYM